MKYKVKVGKNCRMCFVLNVKELMILKIERNIAVFRSQRFQNVAIKQTFSQS